MDCISLNGHHINIKSHIIPAFLHMYQWANNKNAQLLMQQRVAFSGNIFVQHNNWYNIESIDSKHHSCETQRWVLAAAEEHKVSKHRIPASRRGACVLSKLTFQFLLFAIIAILFLNPLLLSHDLSYAKRRKELDPRRYKSWWIKSVEACIPNVRVFLSVYYQCIKGTKIIDDVIITVFHRILLKAFFQHKQYLITCKFFSCYFYTH